MSNLGDVVGVVVRALVDRPQAVKVTETQHGAMTLIEVFAAPDDVGKLIGRQGRTVAALRTLLGATANRLGKNATLEIRDAPARD